MKGYKGLDARIYGGSTVDIGVTEQAVRFELGWRGTFGWNNRIDMCKALGSFIQVGRSYEVHFGGRLLKLEVCR